LKKNKDNTCLEKERKEVRGLRAHHNFFPRTQRPKERGGWISLISTQKEKKKEK